MPLLGFTFGFGAKDVGMKNAMNSAESGVMQITEAINKAGKKARTSGLNTFFNGLSSMRLGEVANNTKELADSSGELTSGLEAQFVAMDKEVRPIIARFGLVGEEASKTKSKISSLAYSLNTGASQVAEAWSGLRTAGSFTKEVFEEMGLGLKELVKLEATTGVQTKELAHTVADLEKSWGLNKEQVKGVLSGLTKVSTASGRAGKAFGDLKGNMSALTDIYAATGKSLSPKKVAKLAVQTEKLAGVFVHGLGTSAEEAGQKALGVMKKLAEEEVQVSHLMSGLDSKYSDFFMETVKASGFESMKDLLKTAADDPVKALSTFQEMWKHLQEAGDTAGMERFSKNIASIGPDFAFLVKGGERTSEAIKKMNKASMEGSGSLKKLAEAGHSTGLTMQDNMDRMKEKFQQSIRNIAKDSVGGFVERQRAGYNSLKKSLNKYADAPGWGTIIKRMSLISQVGVTGMVMPMKKSLGETEKEAMEVSKALGEGGILGRLKALKAGGFKTLGVEAGASFLEAGNQMSAVQDKLTGFAILAGQVGSAMAHLGKTLMPLIIAMPALKGIVGGLGGAFVGLIKAVSGIGGILVGAFGFLFSLPGLIIAALASVFLIFTDYGKKIRETIKEYFVKGIEAIFGKDVLKDLGGNLTSSFTSIFESVVSVLKNIGEKVWGVLKGVFNQMAEGFSKAGQWLLENAGAIKDVAGSILGFIGKAIKYAIGLVPKIAGFLGSFFVSILDSAKNIFVNVFDNLGSWISESSGVVAKFSTSLGKTFLNAFDSITDQIPGIVNSLAVGMSSISGSIKRFGDVLYQNFDGFLGVTRDFGANAADSIGSGFRKVGTSISDALPKIKETITNFLEISAKFLHMSFKIVSEFVEGAVARVPVIFEGLKQSLREGFQFLIVDPLNYMMDITEKYINTDMLSNISSYIGNFAIKFAEKMGEVSTAIKNSVAGMFNTMKVAIGNFLSRFANWFSSINWKDLLFESAQNFSVFIKKWWNWIVDFFYIGGLEAISGIARATRDLVNGILIETGAMLSNIDFGGFATKISLLIVDVFIHALELAKKVFIKTLETITTVGDMVASVIGQISSFFAKVDWYGLGQSIGEYLVMFFAEILPRFLWKAIKLFGKVLWDAVNWLAINAVPTAFNLLKESLMLTANMLKGILDIIYGIFAKVGEMIFMALWDGIVWLDKQIKIAGQWLWSQVTEAFTNPGEFFGKMMKGAGDLASMVGGAFKDGLSWAFESTVGLIKKAGRKIINGIIDLINKFVRLHNKIPSAVRGDKIAEITRLGESVGIDKLAKDMKIEFIKKHGRGVFKQHYDTIIKRLSKMDLSEVMAVQSWVSKGSQGNLPSAFTPAMMERASLRYAEGDTALKARDERASKFFKDISSAVGGKIKSSVSSATKTFSKFGGAPRAGDGRPTFRRPKAVKTESAKVEDKKKGEAMSSALSQGEKSTERIISTYKSIGERQIEVLNNISEKLGKTTQAPRYAQNI